MPGVLNETVLTMAQARRAVPTRPDISTLFRWCRRCVRPAGARDRVYLEHARVRGRIVTSSEALRRFFDALTAPVADAPRPSVIPRQTATPRDHAAAEKFLDAHL